MDHNGNLIKDNGPFLISSNKVKMHGKFEGAIRTTSLKALKLADPSNETSLIQT